MNPNITAAEAKAMPKTVLDEIIGWAHLVLGLGFLIWAPYYLYRNLDGKGWVPHYRETRISIQDNWLDGESKECFSTPLDSQDSLALGENDGFALSNIRCDAGPEHTIRVRFFGLTNQPLRGWVTWKCTRTSDDFTCKQTGRSGRVIRSRDVNTSRAILSYDSGKTWQFADQ